MGTFRDHTLIEHIHFSILPYRNKNDRTVTSFTVTHKS